MISYDNPLIAYVSSISKQFSRYIFLILKFMLGFVAGLRGPPGSFYAAYGHIC
jgi:hypothetical protein